jgi:hypothetical protein
VLRDAGERAVTGKRGTLPRVRCRKGESRTDALAPFHLAPQGWQQANANRSGAQEKTTNQGELHDKDLEQITGGKGGVTFSDIKVVKYVDAATP